MHVCSIFFIGIQRQDMSESVVNEKTLVETRVLEGCRGGETRTHDLFVPNEARYQLRYTPKIERTQN